MNPEQAERIASALETIAIRLGHISDALDAQANQGDMMASQMEALVDILDRRLQEMNG